MERIDNKDMKLIFELRKNCRQTYSNLAKSVGVSKQLIQYKINRLTELGILVNKILAIDAGKIDYQNYGVYLQWDDETIKDAFVNEVVKDKNIRYAADGRGEVDFIVSFYARNPVEFQQMWDKYVSKYGSSMRSHSIHASTELRNFEKSYLIGSIQLEEKEPFLGSTDKKIEIDDTDISILRTLNDDARASILSISKKCNLAPDTVKSRIKSMESSGLIQGYLWLFDLKALDVKLYEVLFSLKNMDVKTWNKLLSYCRTNPNITMIIRYIGEFDVSIIFEVKEDNIFDKEFHELRRTFSKNVHRFEIIKVLKEYIFRYAPFL